MTKSWQLYIFWYNSYKSFFSATIVLTFNTTKVKISNVSSPQRFFSRQDERSHFQYVSLCRTTHACAIELGRNLFTRSIANDAEETFRTFVVWLQGKKKRNVAYLVEKKKRRRMGITFIEGHYGKPGGEGRRIRERKKGTIKFDRK